MGLANGMARIAPERTKKWVETRFRKDEAIIPHLAMTGEPRGFSRVAAGFSSYDGDFRLPLVLGQGRFHFLGL